MKLLHLCYWELEGLDLSQTFCSPRAVSNYWNVAVNGVYPNGRDPFYLEEAEQLFGPATAKALADQKRLVQVNKEETFETIRQAEFPDRPSRRNCMFTFLSNDPEGYMTAFNWTKEQFHLVEIELVGPDTRHFAADHTILWLFRGNRSPIPGKTISPSERSDARLRTLPQVIDFVHESSCLNLSCHNQSPSRFNSSSLSSSYKRLWAS